MAQRTKAKGRARGRGVEPGQLKVRGAAGAIWIVDDLPAYREQIEKGALELIEGGEPEQEPTTVEGESQTAPAEAEPSEESTAEDDEAA
jgi:hypothetical protein